MERIEAKCRICGEIITGRNADSFRTNWYQHELDSEKHVACALAKC